jgi:hypothetical protein
MAGRAPLEDHVPVMPAAASAQELRLLIAQLERSGIADARPEARALLERSRALLRQRHPVRRRLTGKLLTLLGFAVDATLLAALPILVMLALAGRIGASALALALFMPFWALFRLRRHLHVLAEPLRWLAYHLAWGWDWLAEAFSLAAADRLGARQQAREVMWGWRQHRRSLPRRATLDDVAAYLAVEYGPQAAREFRRGAEALDQARAWTLRGGTRRNRARERLAALRWSALIGQFGHLAASGAIWPGIQEPAEASPVTEGAASVPEVEDTEPPERAARRADLRDMIRHKRQDITAAFGWKLKTAAEIAQRDVHLAQLRADITALEQELAQLGG